MHRAPLQFDCVAGPSPATTVLGLLRLNRLDIVPNCTAIALIEPSIALSIWRRRSKLTIVPAQAS
jgi:hypothetical protein